MLGCAVHSDGKEVYIEKIKTLDIEIQQSIVECIKKVEYHVMCDVAVYRSTDVNCVQTCFRPYYAALRQVGNLLISRRQYFAQADDYCIRILVT